MIQNQKKAGLPGTPSCNSRLKALGTRLILDSKETGIKLKKAGNNYGNQRSSLSSYLKSWPQLQKPPASEPPLESLQSL